MKNHPLAQLLVVASIAVSDAFAPIPLHRQILCHSHVCSVIAQLDCPPLQNLQQRRDQQTSLVMKVRSQGGTSGRDSILSETNRQRVATAGRRGTKRFVDPAKVFVGGLPFDATEDDLKAFFVQHLGHARNVHSIKIIRDWKTNMSKGYAFVIFTDPMFATCAMEFCKNKKMNGRTLTLDQGKRKIDPNTLYVKKSKKSPVDDEESAIQAGLDDAEAADSSNPEDEMWAVEDFDEKDDAILFADEIMDDDDFEYDGVFEDIYPVMKEPLTEEEAALNREQRREVQKRKSRRKLPSKGFGVSN